MPTNEYMTPEISKIIPMLTQTCDELTRQALIRGLTQKTQEWAMGDPELADILLEGKKTLEECIRYVTEKAAVVAAKNVNAMLEAEFSELPRMQVRGMEVPMAGAAVDSDQVYKWAQEYYYDPDAKPTDFKKEAEKKAADAKIAAEKAVAEAEKAAADAKKKTRTAEKDFANADKSETRAEQPPDILKDTAKDKSAMNGGEQISFGSLQSTDNAA